MTTKEDMETLFKNFPIAEVLAEKLRNLMTPGDLRIPSWHPGYFRDELEKDLPEEYKSLVKKADFWDFSFVKELEKVPGMLVVDPVEYPALFKPFDGSRLFIVPISLFRSITATSNLNVSALRELSSTLVESGHDVWFTVPEPLAPSDNDKRNALREALLALAKSKPKVFAETTKTALHVAGFDSTHIATKKQVFTLLEELLASE
jgi:hypothetical protein